MASGNQIYMTDKELRLLLEMIDVVVDEGSMNHADYVLLGSLAKKIELCIRPIVGESRPLKIIETQ